MPTLGSISKPKSKGMAIIWHILPSQWNILKLACSNQDNANAQERAGKHFLILQEAAEKDFKQAFGSLLAQFHISIQTCRLWSLTEEKSMIQTSIILHDMIVDEIKHVDLFLLNKTTDSTLKII